MLKCWCLCTLVYTDTDFAEHMTPLSADESVAQGCVAHPSLVSLVLLVSSLLRKDESVAHPLACPD